MSIFPGRPWWKLITDSEHIQVISGVINPNDYTLRRLSRDMYNQFREERFLVLVLMLYAEEIFLCLNDDWLKSVVSAS